MKKKQLLITVSVALILATLAFVPSLTDFCVNQFGTGGNKVVIKNGALTTNMSARGLVIPNATVSRALVTDSLGNATNASGTPDGTKFLNDAGAYATPPAGGQLATNGDQFAANTTLNIKNAALLTNAQIRGITMPNVTVSLPAIINAHGDLTNATGVADTTTFLRGDGTLAVPAYPAAADTTATDWGDYAIEIFTQYATGIPVLTNGFGWYGGGRLVGGQIVSRTISGYLPRTEKRLALTNGLYSRTFAWGNQWKHLRLGVLWSVNSGASCGVTNLYYGINSGTNNTPFDASTSAYIGTANLNGVGTWVFAAGTDYPYFLLANMQNFVTRRATTSTNVAGIVASLAPSSTHTNRLLFALDISRTGYGVGVTYTVQGWGAVNNAAGRESDWNYRAVQSTFTQFVAGNGSWNNLTPSTSTTTVFDENGGPLDTFVFAWDNATVALELSAIIIQRLN